MSNPGLEARHDAFGLNSRFDGQALAFPDYIAHCRDIIRKSRTDLTPENVDSIVEGNAPFELIPWNAPRGTDKPYKRGVLLIHGLTDSPYFMRHLGAFFQAEGYLVMAILLPGHGTRPGDLLDTDWEEWRKAASYAADKLAEKAEELFIAGLSAGAALGILQTFQDNRIRGLFLFAPALQISNKAAHADWHKLYSWLIPAAKWVRLLPDRDCFKYESFAKHAAAEMYALTQALEDQLARRALDIPVFVAASAEDATVSVPAIVDFAARLAHPASHFMLFAAAPIALPEFRAASCAQIASAVPEEKILSLSHTALVIPPHDGHYGAQGDYVNCTHYYPDEMAKYETCLSNTGDILQGEITGQNLAQGLVRRLMYNPHFNTLLASMKNFIHHICPQ
jgi:esterase/lipase